MDAEDAPRRVEAAILMRGDLTRVLPPEIVIEIDTQLQDAIALADTNVNAAAEAITTVRDAQPVLRARLTTFERYLCAGMMPEPVVKDYQSVDGPPGNPGTVVAAVWTCPTGKPHFQRLRRFPNEPMGSCPDHGFPLVPLGDKDS